MAVSTASAINIRDFDAVLFDLDGVVTDTAHVHAATWKKLFDGFLRERSETRGERFVPFDEVRDYLRSIDGKPRYDGARDFLQSRGIELPYGNPSDPPGHDSICALGNLKNEIFQEHLERHGVEPFHSTIRFIDEIRADGLKTAIISSSKNCEPVLRAAGIADLFDAKVDGGDLAQQGLEGKPDPAMFLLAAEELGVEPEQAIVVEDAVSGVEAGREGRFGLVIGIDRTTEGSGSSSRSTSHSRALLAHGADIVVHDLEQLVIEPHHVETMRSSNERPSALERFDLIARRLRGRRLVLFLDYDGTLTPIVQRPEDAALSGEMRGAVKRLTQRCPVAVVSGRDMPDVRERVSIDNVFYAGSHGFDIEGPRNFEARHEAGKEFLPALDALERELHKALDGIDGTQVERKRYSIAVHYRRMRDEEVSKVAIAVDDVLSRHEGLRKTHGKKVFDLQPDIDWHKGRAVEWLLDALKVDREKSVAIYIGDDRTDEDAFAALVESGAGFGVIVADEPRQTSAEFSLRGTDEVAAFLVKLAEQLEAAEMAPP